MTTIEYLDAVKKALNITSDYALAKALGISKQAVSRYYSKGGGFDDDVARKVASYLGLNAGLVMLDMHQQRAQSPETAALWKEIYKGFRTLSRRAKTGGELLLARS